MERKKAKEGRVDGGGRKAFPTRGSQGVRRVKVDVSIQTAIIPAKAFLSLPINFFSFHKPYTLYFHPLSEKGKRNCLANHDSGLSFLG